MIAGVGTDIVSAARFINIGERFKERCYTEAELEYLKGKPAASWAGIFAAKEAVVKALGMGFAGFWPSDVEITHEENGRPGVVLHGRARQFAEGLAVWVSISHSNENAVAFAVAEKFFTHRDTEEKKRQRGGKP